MLGRGGKTLVGIVCALTLAPSPAQADPGDDSSGSSPEPRPGLQTSLRLGYSRPIGHFRATGNYEISEGIGGAVPIIVDLGYRFRSAWSLGVFGGVVPGVVGDELNGLCESAGCGVVGFRFGGLASAQLNRDGKVSPWLAMGLGGEIFTIYVSDARGDVASTVRGFNFADVLFGVDYRVSRRFGLGPFVQMAAGIYTHRRVSTPRYTADEVMEEWIPHAWFTAGARAVLWP